MIVNHLARELNLKIALVGPKGAGKARLLEAFEPLATPRGKPQYVDSVHDAVMAGAFFVDFVPPYQETVRGLGIRVQLHSMSQFREPTLILFNRREKPNAASVDELVSDLRVTVPFSESGLTAIVMAIDDALASYAKAK